MLQLTGWEAGGLCLDPLVIQGQGHAWVNDPSGILPLLSSHSQESWDPEPYVATFSLALTNSHAVALWLFFPSFPGLCSLLKTLERILFCSDESPQACEEGKDGH